MENADIIKVINDCNLHFNEIADEMNVPHAYFSKLILEDLSLEDSNRIIDAINSLNAKRWREENTDGKY